jgi:eukaryotic-like serine/threonine-protein kinase
MPATDMPAAAGYHALVSLGDEPAGHAVDELVRLARPDSVVGERAAQAELQRGSFGAPRRITALARYVLLAQLGAGGDGVVYRAWDPELDRDVAIKLLRRRDREAELRLRREARALAQLSHPHVVKIHDVGHCDDVTVDDLDGSRHAVGTFLVMEYVRGGDFAAWIAKGRRPWRELVRSFCSIGRALAAAHDVGIVHRDVKPSNVLIDERGRPLLVDFGLAERSSAAPPTTGDHVVGTLPYMAPEQHRGALADVCADQYAFAVSLYEALTGRRPFAGPHRAMLDAKDHAEYPRLTEVPGEIRRAIARALAPGPRDRFSSMHELVRALERGLRRHHGGWWLAAAALPAALTAAWLAVDDACELPEHGPHATVRNERAALLERLPASDDGREAIATVDEVADAWASTWHDVCVRTHVLDEQSVALHDSQLACLSRNAAAFEVVLDELVRAELPAPVFAIAFEAAEPPQGCASPSSPTGAAGAGWGAIEGWRELASARVMQRLGRDADALAVVRASLRANATLDAPRLAARLHLVAAAAHGDLGEYASATEDLFAALWAAERVRDEGTAAAAWIELAWVHGVERGDPLGARWASFAGAAVTRDGDDPLLLAELAHLRGGLHYHAGRWVDALDAYRGALATQRELLGDEHPKVARTLNHIGNTLAMMGQLDEAFAHSSRALAVRRRVLPPGHPLIAAALNNLAGIRIQQHRFEEALAFADESLAIDEGQGGPHELVARVLRAQSLRGLGRIDEAISNYRGALAVRMATIERDHPTVSGATAALAELEPLAGGD